MTNLRIAAPAPERRWLVNSKNRDRISMATVVLGRIDKMRRDSPDERDQRDLDEIAAKVRQIRDAWEAMLTP